MSTTNDTRCTSTFGGDYCYLAAEHTGYHQGSHAVGRSRLSHTTWAPSFEEDLAELYQLADRALAAIKTHGGIDYARTQLAAHNIGCGIETA